VSETGDQFEAEFEKLRKSLGLDSRSIWRSDIDEFLGRAPRDNVKLKKLPTYVPFFPLDAISAFRHISEGHSSPSRDSERELIRAFQAAAEGSKEQQFAFNQILKAFIRLLIHRSRQHVNSGIPQEDIVQESVLGLLRATQKADMSLGNRFSTYASSWIDQTAGRLVANESRVVRIPVQGHEVIRKTKAIRRSDFLNGRPFRGYSKVESELGLSSGSLHKLMEADVMTLSLERWRRSHDIEDSFDVLEHVESEELKRDLLIALDMLKPRESGVLKCRYGIETGQPMTLEDIGEKFGLTRERIRQIDKLAKIKLLKGPLSEKLRAHAGLEAQIEAVEPKEVQRKKRSSSSPPRSQQKGRSNTERTLDAASNTVQQVEEALKLLGDSVPPDLRLAGEVRLQNPNASLSELGELSIPPISKHTVVGRIRRLISAAEHKRTSAVTDIARPVEIPQQEAEQTKEQPSEQTGAVLTDELWREICRKTELAIRISGGRLSSSEKEVSDWVLSRKLLTSDSISKETPDATELKGKLKKLKFLIGDPWR
jgi:RNA polymerase nonessential primary-like sigma factor